MMKKQFKASCFTFLAAGLLMAGTASAQKATAVYSAKNKSAKVYVTEKGTENRITPTETLHF